MLISTIEELEVIYPTSRWDNINKLLPLFSKVERSKLAKYLGLPLLQLLNKQYRDLCDAAGGISALSISEEDAHLYKGALGCEVFGAHVPFILDVIRTCQEIIVYITLANNTRILSSSLNQGGGFNSMTTEDYDQQGDTQLKALSAELWRNAMDSVDSLLVLLEQDAKGPNIYASLWSESNYYYMHSDLIFRTADELSHYIPLDGGRASYIQLTPGLRNMQNQYVETRVGHEVMNLLIEDRCPEDVNPELWKAFSRHIRLALANYTNIELLRLKASSDKNSTQSRARSEMENDYHLFGDREMSLALDVLFLNPSEFKGVIDASNILQYEYQHKTSQSWQSYLSSLEPAPEADGTQSCECKTPRRKSHSSLCDLGGWHTM